MASKFPTSIFTSNSLLPVNFNIRKDFANIQNNLDTKKKSASFLGNYSADCKIEEI